MAVECEKFQFFNPAQEKQKKMTNSVTKDATELLACQNAVALAMPNDAKKQQTHQTFGEE